MEQMMMQAMQYGVAAAFMPLLVAIYFFVVWDAHREGSASAGDTQIGIKVAIHVFALVAIVLAAGGVTSIITFVLFKVKSGGSSEMIKAGIGNIIVGGGVFFVCWQMLLPRTNWKEHEKVTRLTLGGLAAVSGIIAITTFAAFVSNLIMGARWIPNSMNLSTALVFGAIGFFSLMRLGSMSGWVAPPPKAAGFPPAAGGGGYDPNQGYQQQPPQGGYPPQGGGGTPPAGGGGYPPQGGGAPPAGGGY